MTVFYSGGCLLPFLIIFNLFFGRLFFSARTWLAVELLLVSAFFAYSYFLTRRVMKYARKRSGAIDVEGEIIKDAHKLK